MASQNPISQSVAVRDAGTLVPVKVNSDGSINVSSAATPGYSSTNITTATTPTVKTGSGTLHSININTAGGAVSTTTVYDNTAGSGTKLATIDSTKVGPNVYDVAFATGLTLVTTGSGAPDVTVAWR